MTGWLAKLANGVSVTGYPLSHTGVDVHFTGLSTREQAVVDTCIAALIDAIPEIVMTIKDFYVLREAADNAPASVDVYASRHLPRRLWGAELRVLYGTRPQSTCVCFCEARSVTAAQWAEAKAGAVGLARDLGARPGR